ncbi:MAG TPA: VOC family protein [Steroidobacteraceae bacterium]|nr:VOC family protein [Steroidobacteraceae bacterium]
MAQPSVHGRFIWQELMTDDTAGAADFYAKVIGWQVQSPAHPNGDYSVFANARHPVGGVMSLPQHARDAGARPHWLPYIGADDVDGTVGRVEKLGGKVLRAASDVPDVGRYAVLADPQGAAFGVYHPLQSAAPASGQPGQGEFAWQELATTDFEAAFRFYSELFGWQSLQRMDMGPAGTYLIFGRNGVRQGGIYKLSAQMPAPYWLSYISVPDVDVAAGKAREHAARVINGPMDVPDGGRIAQLLDRSGVLFAIHSQTGATQAHEAAAPKRSAAKPRPAKPSPTPASSAAASDGASVGKAAPRPAGKVAKRAAKKAAKKAPKKAPRKAPAKKQAKRAAKKAAKKVAKKVARKAATRRGARGAGKTVRRAAKRVAKRAGKKAAKKTAKKAGRKAAGKRGGRGRRR